MLSVAHKPPPEDGLERRLREAKDRRTDPLRQQAQRLLEQFQNGRSDVATPATSTKPKRPKRHKARGSSKADAIARTEVNKLVSREAQRNGDYQFVAFKLQEVTEAGRRVDKEVRVVRNLGATPVERWAARGRLEERQLAAILFYQNAWRMYLGEARVTANYSPVIVRNANGATELYAGSRMAAKESLRLLDQEVFFRRPVADFEVWQNVVIWDEPAGVAGARIGFCHKPAEAVAQFIVTRIAGEIADIVIDNSRRDFGDLLLDIDAPRRPGRRG